MRLRKHRKVLEAIEEQAEKQLKSRQTNAAAKKGRNDTKAEVLSTSVVLQMVIDLTSEYHE